MNLELVVRFVEAICVGGLAVLAFTGARKLAGDVHRSLVARPEGR